MNTAVDDRPAQLLVDQETGRVLRGDNQPAVSERWADFHPFIEREGRALFAGPDAKRAATRRRRGEGIGDLDVLEYEIQSEVAGGLHLQRKVDEE